MSGDDWSHPSEGIIVSEHENEPGGPHYGGERGGESAGSKGGQANTETPDNSGGEQDDEREGQAGSVGGRGPTERERG